MPSVCFTLFSVFLIATLPTFSYSFKGTGLLRRAMTHASFSEENNRALSILGASVIETVVSFQSLSKDIDISSRDLNHQIAEISKVESTCTGDALRLGLQKVVRVPPRPILLHLLWFVVHSVQSLVLLLLMPQASMLQATFSGPFVDLRAALLCHFEPVS